MITANCQICGIPVTRAGSVPAVTCSRDCAAELRRRWKPVTEEWLYQKYVVEKIGIYKIGRLAGRNPARVRAWLVNLGIPTREKWQGNVPPPQPYHNKEWLEWQYVMGVTMADIAAECGVKVGTVFRYFKKHGLETRTASESRKLSGKPYGMSGKRNPMFGKKGPLHPNWKGGSTPERQAFYQTKEWFAACSAVWARDNATCQRCGHQKVDEAEEFAVHHIVSFLVKELRAEVPNLVLLCGPCHRWVHSRQNANKEYIKDASDV